MQTQELRGKYEDEIQKLRNHLEMCREKGREDFDNFNKKVNEIKHTYEGEIHRARAEADDLRARLERAIQERDSTLIKGNESQELKKRLEELMRERWAEEAIV